MVDYIFSWQVGVAIGIWLLVSLVLARIAFQKRVENEHFYSQMEDSNASIQEWEFLSVINFISAFVIAVLYAFAYIIFKVM